MKNINIFLVAQWFLSKAAMTHKKLQKLCYYAQAWHCALYKRPMFQEPFEAWVHGPVCRALYARYADMRWDAIPKFSEDDGKAIEAQFGKSESELMVLNAVYDTYGELSGDQLERLTHSEAPWREARGDAGPLDARDTVISCTSMEDFYWKQYQASQND